MADHGNPKVSVIIPTYREENYISILLSRLVRINRLLEIVVVDGGSPDGTVQRARVYTEKVYEINQRGIAKARNYGASKAHGNILIFLDADVNPPPDFVERITRLFLNEKIAGATCQIMPANPYLSEKVFFIFYNGLLRFMSIFRPHSRGEFLAVKHDYFVKVGGFNENLPCLEDHDLAFRISKLGKFVFVADLVVYESMRRFRKLGLLQVLKTWVADYLSLMLFKKTISTTWKPVR